jgi:hypothetical protein
LSTTVGVMPSGYHTLRLRRVAIAVKRP